jgi:CubicO group peptidase (beta-lactamase class C family)
MGSDLEASLAALRAAFERLAADGGTAALVVRRDDEILLDLAAGTGARAQRFSSRTPVFLYSAVKPVAALTVLLAVREGALALDVPVARLWPAFGAHGKDQVTVRQVLGHGAAVPGWREPLALADLVDRDAAADRLAAAVPWWRPGEPGEHATSYGHLLDAVLRHGTGRDIEGWWEEVADSGLGVHLRPGEGRHGPWPLRDADGRWQAQWSAAPGIMGDLLRNPADLLALDVVNGPLVRELIAPAVTGYGSAHDLAYLWSWWTGDAGAERLGGELRSASLAGVVTGHDHVLGREVAWGLGPQVDEADVGMGGVGGCFGAHLLTPGLSVGFTTADLSPPGRADLLDDALDALATADG